MSGIADCYRCVLSFLCSTPSGGGLVPILKHRNLLECGCRFHCRLARRRPSTVGRKSKNSLGVGWVVSDGSSHESTFVATYVEAWPR